MSTFISKSSNNFNKNNKSKFVNQNNKQYESKKIPDEITEEINNLINMSKQLFNIISNYSIKTKDNVNISDTLLRLRFNLMELQKMKNIHKAYYIDNRIVELYSNNNVQNILKQFYYCEINYFTNCINGLPFLINKKGEPQQIKSFSGCFKYCSDFKYKGLITITNSVNEHNEGAVEFFFNDINYQEIVFNDFKPILNIKCNTIDTSLINIIATFLSDCLTNSGFFEGIHIDSGLIVKICQYFDTNNRSYTVPDNNVYDYMILKNTIIEKIKNAFKENNTYYFKSSILPEMYTSFFIFVFGSLPNTELILTTLLGSMQFDDFEYEKATNINCVNLEINYSNIDIHKDNITWNKSNNPVFNFLDKLNVIEFLYCKGYIDDEEKQNFIKTYVDVNMIFK